MGCTLCSVAKYFLKTAIDKEGIHGGKMCYSSNWWLQENVTGSGEIVDSEFSLEQFQALLYI